jgi:hypothetical protein
MITEYPPCPVRRCQMARSPRGVKELRVKESDRIDGYGARA